MRAQTLAATAALLLATVADGARAQASQDGAAFFDLSRKTERVELAGRRLIRFLTDDDYPPFHFYGADGQLTGFNVDLARAICQELRVACTIQPRRWDTLAAAVEENRGDVVIASFASHHPDRGRLAFGVPYYRTPARFVARRPVDSAATPMALAGQTVGVVAGSAHAAFLARFHPKAIQRAFADQDEMLKALSDGGIDLAFGDAVGIAVWLNGEPGARCCAFRGGPYYESRFFGEGAVMAFRNDDANLRKAVDAALLRLAEKGVYRALLLKYFPVAFY